MKLRSGFVSNSSSSSFIITDPDHPGLDILEAHPQRVEVDREEGEVHDNWDNATWLILQEADYEWTDFLEQSSFNG